MQSLTLLHTFAPIILFYALMDSSALANDSIKSANEAAAAARRMSLPLDHMDGSLDIVRRLIDVSLQELDFQLSKGRRSLLVAKKQKYLRTVTGSLLYQVSLLLGIAATYWTRSWASLADTTNVIGQAVEEAAYDFEGFAGLDAPSDLTCIDDFWTHLHDKTQIFNVIAAGQEMTLMERQKRLLEVSKFRIDAQKSLSCLLGKGIEEDEAIGSLLDALTDLFRLLLN